MIRYIKLILLMIGIVISAHGQPYRGAELRTRESFQYGRFEASIKSAQGPGILNSFFTYNDSVPTTLWAEIDFEILGRYSDNVDVNVINVDGSHLRQHPLDFNPHLDFHTYSIEWTPNYVAWFMDGEEFYRQTGTHIDALFQSGKLMMNSWTPIYEDWVGIMDDRILPRFSYYDWVSYAAYTPGTGSVGNDQNFTPVWLDDFDEYDPIRWEKSDGWSWNGNNALLVAENVVYEEGQMILCLTLPGEEGRVDIHPPHALWARAHYPDSVVVQFSEELDPLTAETLSTYAITGAPILAVTLQPDQRTVSLKVQNLSFSGSAVLYAFGIQDLADPVNTQVNTSVSINMPAPLDLPINIDCGGPGAQAFLADQVWSESVEYGHEGGGNQIATWYPDLADTDLDSVMATSLNRFSRYHVRLNQGIFDIQLHFAEHYYDETGERVFQLYVEDSLIVAELDVFNVVGNTGVFSVNLPGFEICDGSLDILGSALNYGEGYAYAGPVLNAIQINGEYWVNVDSNVKPEHYQFNHFYPNPFNSQAHFDFTIPESAWVDIFLYDVRGSLVRELVSQNYYPGGYQLAIDGKDLASGTYIVRLESQNFIKSRKILLLK